MPGALMIDAASKAFFHLLARSRSLQHLASRYGHGIATQLRAPVHRRRNNRRSRRGGAHAWKRAG